MAHSSRDSLPGLEEFLVYLYDEFGDGWSNNQLRVTHCDEIRTAFDPTHDPQTIDDGFDKETYICLPPGIDFQEYEVTLDGGDWQGEISWSITYPKGEGPNDQVWHGGGAPYYYSTCLDQPALQPSQAPISMPTSSTTNKATLSPAHAPTTHVTSTHAPTHVDPGGSSNNHENNEYSSIILLDNFLGLILLCVCGGMWIWCCAKRNIQKYIDFGAFIKKKPQRKKKRL
jgi:hypothetical protein